MRLSPPNPCKSIRELAENQYHSRQKHRLDSIASSLFRLYGIENRLQIHAYFCSRHPFVSHISAQTSCVWSLENALPVHTWQTYLRRDGLFIWSRVSNGVRLPFVRDPEKFAIRQRCTFYSSEEKLVRWRSTDSGWKHCLSLAQ